MSGIWVTLIPMRPDGAGQEAYGLNSAKTFLVALARISRAMDNMTLTSYTEVDG
jgi:hypothetical protein